MNAQLSHQMAQFHQQDLHRRGERARIARAATGESRFAALCRKTMKTRFNRPAAPATRPISGAVSEV